MKKVITESNAQKGEKRWESVSDEGISKLLYNGKVILENHDCGLHYSSNEKGKEAEFVITCKNNVVTIYEVSYDGGAAVLEKLTTTAYFNTYGVDVYQKIMIDKNPKVIIPKSGSVEFCSCIQDSAKHEGEIEPSLDAFALHVRMKLREIDIYYESELICSSKYSERAEVLSTNGIEVYIKVKPFGSLSSYIVYWNGETKVCHCKVSH